MESKKESYSMSKKKVFTILGVVLSIVIIYVVLAFIEFPVSSNQISYNVIVKHEYPDGSDLPDGVVGLLQIEYSLNSRFMVLGTRAGDGFYLTDDSGTLVSSIEILIPRQSLPMLMKPVSNYAQMYILEDRESKTILRCSDKDIEISQSQMLGDYKPMIFIQDILYGDTGNVINDLPDNSDMIGVIETVVPQNAPMVKENNTSNLVQAGSEVYAVPSDSCKIYVRLPDGRYSIYEEIE